MPFWTHSLLLASKRSICRSNQRKSGRWCRPRGTRIQSEATVLSNFPYARGINRIRHLYLEYAPQMQPYFVLSSHDDSASVVGSVGIRNILVADFPHDAWNDCRHQQCACGSLYRIAAL